MNLLRRALTAERLLSPYSSQKRLPVLYPVSLLQFYSLLFSTSRTATTSSRSKTPQQRSTPRNSKTQMPEQSSPLPPSSYSDVVEKKPVDWPRPSEIPWQAKVANAVNLIGQVKIPVQFQASPDGNYWAGTIIAQEDSSTSPLSFWIPVIFEGDLAHIAHCHLREKDYVHVVGQLSADVPPFVLSEAQLSAVVPPFDLSEGQANLQVMVHSLNFVQGSPQSKRSFVQCKPEERVTSRSVVASVKEDVSVHQSLKDVIAKPHEWWDLRLQKENTTDAAFEHKDHGQLLWIDESTPEWFLEKVACLKFDHKDDQKSIDASMTKDGNPAKGSWRDLLLNPTQWWDHRENKRNGSVKAKYPDFKHKDSGFALWLNDAPELLLRGLEGLEFDVPPSKMKQVNGQKDDDSWKDVVENPKKWWDNRTAKMNIRAPDFKHKDTGKALWLSDAPAWALSGLPPLKTDAVKREEWLSKSKSM